MPELPPIVAIEVLAVVQAPPAGVLIYVATKPAHTAEGPAMADGNGLTVTNAVAMQPVEKL
jgi:hypothetical protein